MFILYLPFIVLDILLIVAIIGIILDWRNKNEPK